MPIELSSKPQAIILDMDGVLADTEPIHVQAFRIMLKEYGINAGDEYLNSFIGHSVESNIASINEEYFPEQPLHINATALYRDKIYLDLIKKADLKPMPGIKNLVQFCHAHNITLGICVKEISKMNFGLKVNC